MKKTITKIHRPLADIARALHQHNTFFIAGHMKPDGDTIGTALALSSLLRRLGKKVCVYSPEAVPMNLCFISGSRRIIITKKVRRQFDCAIILECKDLARMGDLITADQVQMIINIDHHADFNPFGTINYLDSTASSSAEQVFDLFEYMKMPIQLNEAEGLYVGLVTDTGQFQHSNTSPDALKMAARLMDVGINPERIYDNLYASNSMSSLHLLGATLLTIDKTKDGKIACMMIPWATYLSTGSDVTETDGIINFAMTMPTVAVGMLLRETDVKGQIKVSLRSRGSINVNAVAHHFGGGGHKKAAGCTLKGTLSSVKRTITDYIQKQQL
ncbi:MAG: DHH family phosphoesterase [Endomicrobiales bacterium]|jgi:phosphoesterase RecJ-like protein